MCISCIELMHKLKLNDSNQLIEILFLISKHEWQKNMKTGKIMLQDIGAYNTCIYLLFSTQTRKPLSPKL